MGQGTVATEINSGIQLLQAVHARDHDLLLHLLQSGIDPLSVNTQGISSLSLAVMYEDIVAVDELLRFNGKGQMLLKDHIEGCTALHKAVLTGRGDLLEKLLEASPYLEDRQRNRKTALFLAVEIHNNGMVGRLLNSSPRAQVYTQCNTRDTPLHEAVKTCDELLDLLLNADDSSKSLDCKNQVGETPIWVALHCERFEAFRILQERGASLCVYNSDLDTLLHLVARQKLYKFLNETLYAVEASDIEKRNRWNDTPLTIADRNGSTEIATLLRKFCTWQLVPNLEDAPMNIIAASGPPKLFYILGSEIKWTRETSEGYWRHLTYDSYQVYEQVFKVANNNGQQNLIFMDFAKQFNANDPRPETIKRIWRRLLTSRCDDVNQTAHPRSFVLAVLYMLHIERFLNERPRGDNEQPGEVKAKRREILKRYDVWVSCTCCRKCPSQSNFANDLGMCRAGFEGNDKCRVARIVSTSYPKSSSGFFARHQQDTEV